jgi:hypothetical protein
MAAPNAPSDDILNYLSSAGVGTIGAPIGWALANSFEADTPNTHVTVYDVGGFAPDAHWLIDYPQIQVRVRGDIGEYGTAYAKIQEVKDAILGITQTTMGGTLYVGILQFGDINFIQYDEPGRPILTANFQIIREPSDATNRIPMST